MDYLLPQLFKDIIIPPTVAAELRKFHSEIPKFLEVRRPIDAALLARLCSTLDQGEAEAIALAIEWHANYVLLDEFEGRRIAVGEQIPVMGTGGGTSCSETQWPNSESSTYPG